MLASFPVPCPAFRRLQYGTASDKKLGMGLRTRLMACIGAEYEHDHMCACINEILPSGMQAMSEFMNIPGYIINEFVRHK